jgi:hypothetical protein
MNKMYELYVWKPVFDEPPPAGDQPPAGDPPKDKSFTQEEVNAIVAKEKQSAKERAKELATELETLKSKSTLTAKEKSDLEKRIENLRKESMTKEELLKADKDKAVRETQKKLDEVSAKMESWKKRYTESNIRQSIMDAALKNEAYNPDQIIAILKPTTTLIEELDTEGKPTGNFVPRVTYQTQDKKGKSVSLEITPAEAVTKMKEEEAFANLFKGKGVGGLHKYNKSGEKIDRKELAKDPAAYREARKKGLI